MNRFAEYHPLVVCLYFAGVLIINIVLYDPVVMGLFFVSQSVLYVYEKGAAGGVFVGKCVGIILICGVLNAACSHRGVTELFYVGELPVTRESFCYGIGTGIVLSASLLVFGSYRSNMSSERMMCLFGRRFPGFSLAFSMALRLVPKVKEDYKRLREAHGVQKGVFSTLVGLTLEESLETGRSMRYRGYGERGRTSIYVKSWVLRDWLFLLICTGLGVAAAFLYGWSDTVFFVYPYVEFDYHAGSVAAYAAFAGLFFAPSFINLKEELRWSIIHSKI